jgi:asparagine synthase (glutamine-hydrolysing)
MCGIAGAISLSKKVNPSIVKKMLSKMVHRGPDGEGMDIYDSIAMGMRRLSIVDIEGGMQPLYNEDKSIVIIGNGEIYNSSEIAKKLKGHSPKTKSDIEMLVHLYEEFGVSGINQAKGMFAFCLYDRRKNIVILARDRMGEKPLYYYQGGDNFLFASEFKVIKSVIPTKKLTLNRAAIDKYFHYYFIPEPETIFNEIKKLPKATAMIIDLNTSTVSHLNYWEPVREVYDNAPEKSIRTTFDRACLMNMQADVPVAVTLSGGIDSGSVLASLANQKQKVTALSVGYKQNSRTDERQEAKGLAHMLDVPFFDHAIDESEFAAKFPSLVYDGDDLIADIAAFSISSIYKFAHDKNFKVLIGGIGGDELFNGYEWVNSAIAQAVNSKKNNNYLLHSFIPTPNRLGFYDLHTPYKQAKIFIEKTYHKEFSGAFPFDNSLSPMYYQGGDSPLEKAYFLNSLLRDYWLTSNCIALTDRLSMSHSVEARSPFLESDFVSSALSSSKNMLSFDKESKYFFKKSIKGLLPDEVLKRPKKGFTPPVSNWLSAVIGKYIHLINVGFLSEQKIINGNSLNLIANCWQIMPMYWYPIYQLLLLEIYGRIFYYGLTPDEIS